MKWHSEKRKIAELNPAPYNPRQMTEKQAKDLGTSLDRFGLAEPIVINLNNTIIGGHQRINILKSKGVDEVEVMVPDRLLTEEEEKELNLRLNKNVGEWNWDALCNFDETVLKGVGFSIDEMGRIFDVDLAEDDFDAQKEYDKIAESTTKPGDVFLLGDHRLMCSDATVESNVDKLMGGGTRTIGFHGSTV